MVKLKIDGKEVQIEKGATILAAAEKVGVRIPTLCYLKKVSPTGACRICVVEIAGADKPMTACNTPATEGMEVTTQSAKLSAIRRQVVELLLVNHPLDCPVCDAAGECELQNICYEMDVTRQPFAAEDVNPPAINHWPLIQQVPNRCILCEKCVKVCHEVIGSSALFVNDKGDRAFIDKHLHLCEFCGSCVAVCPTGTMISKPFKFKARPWELTKVPSVCTTCSAQCQVDLNVKNGQLYRVTSEDGVTVNDGTLCVGGYFGHDYVHAERRLTHPQLRQGGASRAVGWDEALAAVSDHIGQVGGEAVAGLASARLTNEELYLFQKLFRALIGSNNLDSEARFGALRAFTALGSSLGLRGASNRLDRIGQAEAVLVFGADPTAETPAVDWQIETACRKRDAKLVVANLRQVKLSRYANVGLTYRPGSEVDLASALARIILDRGLADNDYLNRFVENADALRQHLQSVDLAQAVAATGLDLALLEEAALYLGQAGSVAVVCGADLLRSAGGEEKVAALANLALVCGALNGDRGGFFPIDEKGNMQGLLDMGVAPELLPGGQDYAAAKGRFEQAWGVKLPTGGRNAQGILEGIEQGTIRLLYLVGVNPLVAFPESARWRKALQKLECLVVQDILASELTELAHVVLPAASAVEKDGSVTSLDQRVNLLNRAIPPVGAARADLEIFAGLCRLLAPAKPVPDETALMEEVRQLTALYGDICFVGGGLRGCLKEPFRPAGRSMQVRLPGSVIAPVSGLQLLVGKHPFHFGTLTGASAANQELAPTGCIEMHPTDAQAGGFAEGMQVRLTSAVGSTTGPVRLNPGLQPGLLFAAYHSSALNAQQLLQAGSNLVAVSVAKA